MRSVRSPRVRILPLTALFLFLLAGAAAAETVCGLPLHMHKYPQGAIRLWLGDQVSSTGVVAVPTDKGIVVIDTSGLPAADRELRRVIARELGRDDFVMLINTHEHSDHTGGNGVYADCEIVGHELVAEGMARQNDDRDRRVGWNENRVAQLEQEVAALKPGDPNPELLREELAVQKLWLEANRENAAAVPPTRTFTDRLKLKMGDETFELFYIGGMHSAGDIAVLIPGQRMLLTGDTMADTWLTETPGCLASFIVRPGVKHDFPKLLKNWNALLERRAEVDFLVTGHWNGELSFEGFEKRVRYVEAMWDGARESVQGGRLEGLLTGMQFADRFPDLVDSPGCSAGNHYMSLVELWSTVSGQRSAAQTLYDLIEAGAPDAELAGVTAGFGDTDGDYYFMENQINGYGYRFLQMERPAEAARLFRINTELYPESWNVFDSYAEALLATGDQDAAAAMYEKSIELNPANENGKTVLARIRGQEVAN